MVSDCTTKAAASMAKRPTSDEGGRKIQRYSQQAYYVSIISIQYHITRLHPYHPFLSPAFAKSDANETNPSNRKQRWIQCPHPICNDIVYVGSHKFFLKLSYLRSKHFNHILHLGTWGMIYKNVVLRSFDAINLCATATLLHITPNMSHRTFM